MVAVSQHLEPDLLPLLMVYRGMCFQEAYGDRVRLHEVGDKAFESTADEFPLGGQFKSISLSGEPFLGNKKTQHMIKLRFKRFAAAQLKFLGKEFSMILQWSEHIFFREGFATTRQENVADERWRHKGVHSAILHIVEHEPAVFGNFSEGEKSLGGGANQAPRFQFLQGAGERLSRILHQAL